MAILFAGTFVFNPQSADSSIESIKHFEDLIAAYATLHRNLSKDLPSAKPTTEPDQLLDRQKALARKIREARAHAHQGDIFTPDISKEFKRLLAIAMQGKNSTDIKKSLQRSEPVQLALHVNDGYPANVPLQSTPPTILMNLPRLPQELEYRIVGHALVLRDAPANVVVDLIPDAIP